MQRSIRIYCSPWRHLTMANVKIFKVTEGVCKKVYLCIWTLLYAMWVGLQAMCVLSCRCVQLKTPGNYLQFCKKLFYSSTKWFRLQKFKCSDTYFYSTSASSIPPHSTLDSPGQVKPSFPQNPPAVFLSLFANCRVLLKVHSQNRPKINPIISST